MLKIPDDPTEPMTQDYLDFSNYALFRINNWFQKRVRYLLIARYSRPGLPSPPSWIRHAKSCEVEPYIDIIDEAPTPSNVNIDHHDRFLRFGQGIGHGRGPGAAASLCGINRRTSGWFHRWEGSPGMYFILKFASPIIASYSWATENPLA